MSDLSLRDEYQSNYNYAHDYWAPFVQNALTYTLAASGYTWSDRERKELDKEHREPIEFNIMRRNIEFFSGYLRDNMRSIVYSPVEGSDEKTSDQFTKLSYYIWDKGHGYPVFLDAADECFKSGISLCGIQMDYSKDFIEGDISFYKRTFNSFYLDPTFENISLEDCSFAITRDLISPGHAKQLLPFIDQKLIDEAPFSYLDNKFITFHPNFTNQSNRRKVLAYDQYYRRTSRRRKYLVDMRTYHARDVSDLSREEMSKLKYGLKRAKDAREEMIEMGQPENMVNDLIPHLEIRDVERPYIELNIMLNGEPVYQGEDPTGITETYPFTPLITYFEPSIWLSSQRIQGIAATEYFNQRQFNKRHMKIQDMFDSVISTGYKYILGTLDDPSELLQAGQNKIIGIDPDSPHGLNSVQELSGINVPPSLLEYAKVLDDLSISLASLNQSVLGIDQGGNTQVSGRLAEVRIAQGLRTNRKVFDNIETAQQRLGHLVLKCIQSNYSPAKVQRIIGEEPTEQFYDKSFEQYDAVIKEGIRSKSQKDAYYFELKELAREGLVQVPQSAFIDALQISGIDDLKKHIEQQQQQQEQQQAQVAEQQKVAMELANSQKLSNLALSKEREARVIADIGLAEERASEASSNLADAALARAKAITELAQMNDEHLMRIAEFINQFHIKEEIEREQVSSDIYEKAKQVDVSTDVQQKLETEST